MDTLQPSETIFEGMSTQFFLMHHCKSLNGCQPSKALNHFYLCEFAHSFYWEMVNNDIFTQPVHQYMLLRLPSQMEAWKTWFENILQQIGHFYFCLVHRALLPVIPDPTPAVPSETSNCLKPQKWGQWKQLSCSLFSLGSYWYYVKVTKFLYYYFRCYIKKSDGRLHEQWLDQCRGVSVAYLLSVIYINE